MKTELSVVIDRPVEEVFAYTNDKVTDWSISCVEEEVLEEQPGGVGTTFRIVTEERGRRMEFRGVSTRWEPPHVSAVRLVGDHFEIDVLYTFEDLGGGRTRVTQASEVRGKGLVGLLFGLFGWLMKRSACNAQEAELQSLKRHCEARARSAAG